tara:strand:+ start:427 stop:612 length:186 start_codon:yes stop_codon:yes gene_type:complete
MEKVSKDIGNELRRVCNRLELANDIIKAIVGYLDVSEDELTEGEKYLLRRSKEFLGENYES